MQFFFAVLCILGLLVSRSLATLATLLFGMTAIWGVHPKNWLRQRWWWLCVLWLAFIAVTYFWSADKHSWHERIDTKIPFLLLPLAFTFLPALSAKQVLFFTVVAAVMILFGAGYSTWYYINNAAYYNKEYGYSTVLPTPIENDHIVFSLTVALFIVWCAFVFPYIKNKVWKVFIVIITILLTAYLHLLSAKSGLLALYIFAVLWVIYITIKKSKVLGITLIIAIAIFLTVAWNYFPTFRQRVWYSIYSYKVYKEGQNSTNYSDIGRLISDDIAIKLIKEHPLTGIGAGDIYEEMSKGYDRWYPSATAPERLFPHNEFLTVALGCGIPAAIVFTILVLYPLFTIKRNRQGFFTLIVWCMLLIPLLVEPFLEIQFGVFVYLFFLLLVWKVNIAGAEQA